MLSVILIWSYMFLTTYLTGYGILRGVTRATPYRVRHQDAYLVCGLAGVTVYAQFFSLLGPVGLAANLLLCLWCVLTAWYFRRELAGQVRETWKSVLENKSGERGKMLAAGFLFLLFAYGASRGMIHYDTGLYHAQSIRWIEEYGVVKGLGNLHCRLAYNSSSFALSALYSMAFLGGQSFHCGAGFLALILSGVCLEAVGSLRKRRLRTSDFARVMGIYYLVNIFDEMVSPASDYFMVLIAFYIVIRWLGLLEEETKEILPYGMLCVLGVFLMTVKLSAALILLLVIYPACLLLREKRWKEIGKYLLLGIVTALPFFIRNVLLSGWLVYPFTRIDLFDVMWKIPRGLADYDAKEIQVWGRGYTDVTRYDISVKEWLPGWFRSLAGSDKLFTAAAVTAMGVLFVYGIGMLCGLWKRRWNILLVQAVTAGSFLFWLCTSPLIRYGCVYVYLTPAVVFGGIYDAVLSGGVKCGGRATRTGSVGCSRRATWTGSVRCSRKAFRIDSAGDTSEGSRPEDWQAGDSRCSGTVSGWRKIFSLCAAAAVTLLLVYKMAALGKEIVSSYVNDYWIVQKDYENYETLPYEIEGVTFYYPVQGDQAGYEAFPSAPSKVEVEFLGADIRDGFQAAQ